MANIILYTDFVGKIKLPNTDPTTDAEGSDLLTFITDNEETFLTEILGYAMAKVAIPAFAVPPTTGIWYDLLYGAEFTDKHGRLNKWCGFRNTVQKLSIANYIYCKYIESFQNGRLTSMGFKKAKTENAFDASPISEICKAWNEMVDLNFIMDDFLVQNASSYPDYIGRSTPYPYHWRVSNQNFDYGNSIYYTKRNILGL